MSITVETLIEKLSTFAPKLEVLVSVKDFVWKIDPNYITQGEYLSYASWPDDDIPDDQQVVVIELDRP